MKKHRLFCAKFLCASLLGGVCLSRVDYAPHAVYEAIITRVKWIFTSNCSLRRLLSSHVISYSSRIVGDVVDTFHVPFKILLWIRLNIAVRPYANYIDFNTKVLVYFHVSKDARVLVIIHIQLNTDSLIDQIISWLSKNFQCFKLALNDPRESYYYLIPSMQSYNFNIDYFSKSGSWKHVKLTQI